MTWVGFDVHARSTSGAAIDTMTGELSRVRFGPGIEGPLAWLAELPGPVRACYEAGPTGFGLYRAAVAAGVAMAVIAPGKRRGVRRIASKPIARTPSCSRGCCWPDR
jgi:hypothetical protein